MITQYRILPFLFDNQTQEKNTVQAIVKNGTALPTLEATVPGYLCASVSGSRLSGTESMPFLGRLSFRCGVALLKLVRQGRVTRKRHFRIRRTGYGHHLIFARWSPIRKHEVVHDYG